MKKFQTPVIIALLFSFIPSFVSAHPGRTDSSGCHTCRTNCSSWGFSAGEYHCHASKGVPQPIEPVRSIRGDNGTGVTVPAPEYKTPKSPRKTTVPLTTTSTTPSKNNLTQTSLQNVQQKNWITKLFHKIF